MADAPASLKQADANIYKTAMRAEQLQSVKPIIAYWCDYWVLKQILAKGLHNSSPELLDYSSRLMDKMEQVRDTYGNEDAIADDTAGQAYVEQFAQETLDRAQRVVKAGKVTATTANTFDAAATFFGLVNVWGAPDAETLQKIKYAKWNATRILKAYKEGTDPNASNPKPDDLPPQDLPPTDDPLSAPPSAYTNAPRPVTIEDDPDDASSHQPSELRPDAAGAFTRRDSAGVSLPHSPASSAGGGDHAAAAAPDSGTAAPDPFSLPSVPSHTATPQFSPAATAASPTLPTFSPTTAPPDMFYESAPPAPPSAAPFQPSAPSVPPTFAASPPSTAAIASPPPAVGGYGAPDPATTPGYPPSAAHSRPAPRPVAPPSAPPSAPLPPNTNVDDLAMANAQKHAKWAISALNFEDVATATRELRLALQLLGAS